MADVTVKQLADTVGTPVERLLEQLRDSGVVKKAGEDAVSADEKSKLLEHLRRTHGKSEGGDRKITLKRKSASTLKVGSAASGKKTVNVEVRGRRTLVKRGAVKEESAEKASSTIRSEREREEVELKAMEGRRVAAETAKRDEVEQKRVARENANKAPEAVVETPAPEKAEAAVAEKPAKAVEAKSTVVVKPNAEMLADASVAAASAETTTTAAAPRKAAPAKAKEKSRSDNRRGGGAAGRSSGGGASAGRSSGGGGSAGRNSGGGKLGRKKPGGRDKPGRGPRRRGLGGAQTAEIEGRHGFERPVAPVIRDVVVPETISVAELADRMSIKAGQVIRSLMGMGVMATINQVLDHDTALLIVEEMGHKAVSQSDENVERELTQKLVGLQGESSVRPPVVTVMGHVDHGKTSLLDYIRKAKVTAGEAGGITQHIGAYHVDTGRGVVTFLDTPGHAAFTAMRARGAQATDIVILVVAADDGVMPQTIEAIQHAKAAGVPLVVAVNKIDREAADPERVRSELSNHEVISEEWGGDTQFKHVSALTGEGVDELLESLVLQAELLELKAPATGRAQGMVIEATLDRGRGPVATVLVQSGTLNRGDIIVCGTQTGRVRALFDESGKQVESAGPSIPVQVLGLSATPNAGDEMQVAADDRDARELIELRRERERNLRLAERKPASMEDIFSKVKNGQKAMVNLVVKTDVQGSYEALRESLEKMSTDEVQIRVIGGGVGGINESDATLSAASGAILIGFNTRADASARTVIQEQNVDLHYYSVIYDAIDMVRNVGSGLLAPEVLENIIGLAEVKDVFRSPKFGQAAGCQVVDGVVRKSAPIRVLRDNIVIFEGELESLRRFKDDVNEVRMGTECGIAVKNYDVRTGDQIEVFERKEVARTL